MTFRSHLCATAALCLLLPASAAAHGGIGPLGHHGHGTVTSSVPPGDPTGRQGIPLTGKGENIEGVARVEIAGVNEVELAADWAFISTDEVGDRLGGLVIVNVDDPTKPFVEGEWNGADAGLTDASWGDVDLSPDGNLAVLTNAHCRVCKEGEVVWVALIDVTDKANPRLIGKVVDDGDMDYVHTSTLDNNLLFTNPQVAGFYPQPGNAHVTVFDISDPSNPVKKGTIGGPASELGLAHDSYVDHRPDGKTLLYGASIHLSDVFDITDPLKATWLQTTTSPQYSMSHDVQPNHDRSILVVDDEGLVGGQLVEEVSACGKVGANPMSVNSGSVHFFEAAPDGTFANEGVAPLGSFNAPTNVNTGACVAHVFWQAPDENRLTQAYYRTGAFVLDFENPANPKMLGWFVADGGAKYWSNKPHNGYLFASDMEHGLDILKYTGEGGTRWPATAGPAERQRAARQGVPYVPIDPDEIAKAQGSTSPPSGTTAVSGSQVSNTAGTERRLGAFGLRVRVARVPGRAGTRRALVLRFSDTKGRKLGRLIVRRAAARAATVRVRGVAVAGRYRWTLTAGRKVLRSGAVRAKAAPGLSLPRTATLKVSVVR